MNLIIRQELVGEIKKIIVSFANKELQIYDNSDQWNSPGINKFLIELACAIPENENIELDYDKDNTEDGFKHIVMLFNDFAKEYNSSILNNN